LAVYGHAQCSCFKDQAHFRPTSRVKPYWSAEDSSLVDAPAFFRLIVRDVEGELQRMLEGMRQAVMLAAVSTDG
jgi:hypothetical protein